MMLQEDDLEVLTGPMTPMTLPCSLNFWVQFQEDQRSQPLSRLWYFPDMGCLYTEHLEGQSWQHQEEILWEVHCLPRWTS